MYSTAVKDRCHPTPQFDFDTFACDDGFVVAVNVWPSTALIGVIVKAHKEKEGYGGESLVFPVRVGSHTNPCIEPKRLAMYMLPEVRRNFILISRIPVGQQVQFELPSLSGSVQGYTNEFKGVDYEKNLIMFASIDLPLDQVRTVFQAKGGQWQVAFKAFR